MSNFDSLLQSVSELSVAEQHALREFLASHLAIGELHASETIPSSIGLFADDPEMVQQIIDETMRSRASRPLRLPGA